MTSFLQLLDSQNKANSLLDCCDALRSGHTDPRIFELEPELFRAVPGAPFAYAVSDELRRSFSKLDSVSSSGITVAEGLNTTDNDRFVRLNWEVGTGLSDRNPRDPTWIKLAKGGEHSLYYADLYLSVKWKDSGAEMKAISKQLYGSETKRIYGQSHYFRPGLTYSQRTQKGLSLRALPAGAIFNVKGPAIVSSDKSPLELLGIMNSVCFRILVELQTAFGSYNVGYLQRTPLPPQPTLYKTQIESLTRKAWSLKRTVDTIEETSHAFLLPATLRLRLGDYDPATIEGELAAIQAEIDNIAFDLYGFSDSDRAAALGSSGTVEEDDGGTDADDSDEHDGVATVDQTDGLLSWAAGVAFGRFDWRLAAGERDAPPEPDPFDPLPAKSPGMRPDDAEPFYAHSGILVDDQGHPNDLTRLIEEVLARVQAPIPADVRRWLQRDFFPLHLKQYSKSRRKAPIYWPISTNSGSYTLWLYYPSLTDQTLFTAVNDFIEPKLKQVGQDVAALRTKGSARSRDDEKTFEALQTLELDLIELRDTLLAIAQTYRPNHDDGVQITAAPLWQLFRHKPWQKILKDTWAKLEKGDYDWAHLAMAYWPDRVREKCETDKSLAIAHDLEHVYVEPEPTKARGRKKDG